MPESNEAARIVRMERDPLTYPVCCIWCPKEGVENEIGRIIVEHEAIKKLSIS